MLYINKFSGGQAVFYTHAHNTMQITTLLQQGNCWLVRTAVRLLCVCTQVWWMLLFVRAYKCVIMVTAVRTYMNTREP